VKLWKRYGSYILAAALLIVVGTGGYVVWQRQMEARRLEQSRTYQQALAFGPSKPDEALAALKALDGGSGPYAMLARFQEAALKAKQGDTAGALAVYDALARDSGVGPVYRDAATILYAMLALDSEDPKAVMDRLRPLTGPSSPWRHSALELTGLAAQRAGDADRAKEIFTALSEDREAPAAMRSRAAQILAGLQG
ncbi:MAG: tetratricopeptide repeat protein, partial [Rhodospirillaceae bacterium]|nr:tetratricopeptide repeat protein [Rhodospirillaceae bacterium]